jgi:hypothetical protein
MMKNEVLWGVYKPQYVVFINDVEIYVNEQKEYLSKLREWYNVYTILKQHLIDPSKDDKVNFFKIEESVDTLYKLINEAEQYLKNNML